MTDGTCYLCGETYTGRGTTRHLRVRGACRAESWLHLGIDAGATLADLADLLWDVWLECCGHLSAFDVGGARSERPLPEDQPTLYERRSTDVAVGDVLVIEEDVTYEYDFGTTSELSVRVVDVGPYDAGPSPPEISCEDCEDAPADTVCVEHLHYPDEAAWFCEGCASEHGCEDRLFLPVVNSPPRGARGFVGARLTDWTPG